MRTFRQLRRLAPVFVGVGLSAALLPLYVGAQDVNVDNATPPAAVTCSTPSTTCSTSTFNITAPCRITTAGSYKLTANVSQASNTIDGIEVGVNNVTLDLNGWRVKGSGAGDCVGINACQSGTACNSNIAVRNGTVTAFGGPGIQLGVTGITTPGTGSLVYQVRSYGNGAGTSGGAGIVLGDYSTVIDDIASGNGDSTTGDGIDCGTGCLAQGNVSFNMIAERTERAIIAAMLLSMIVAGSTGSAAFATTCGANISGPCKITSSGHYTLTSDFSTSMADGIDVEANDVVIDLDGHNISASGNMGIAGFVSGTCVSNVSVRQGHLNSSSVGLCLCDLSDVEQVQAYSNGTGLDIFAAPGGASKPGTSILLQNIAVKNSSDGIDCGSDCLISQNVASDNSGTGIETLSRTSPTSSAGLVVDNTAANNSSNGLNLATNAGYSRNVLGGNDSTTTGSSTCALSNQSTGGLTIGDNVCNGSGPERFFCRGSGRFAAR